MEHYIKSAAVYRSEHLRQALSQAYLADNCDVRIQLADEIEDLERLQDAMREEHAAEVDRLTRMARSLSGLVESIPAATFTADAEDLVEYDPTAGTFALARRFSARGL